MPANLPPQYYAAKKRFDLAKDVDEKLEILKEMQAIMPKHKGTDKLRAELRSKIATFRKEAAKRPSKRRKSGYHVEKQGAAQIALIGFPNSGKSSLLVSLTNADSQVAAYPFTTAKPIVGMMPFEDISMQLVDTPPISDEFLDPLLPDLLRRLDLMLLIVDIGKDNALDQIEIVKSKLMEARIKLTGLLQHDFQIGFHHLFNDILELEDLDFSQFVIVMNLDIHPGPEFFPGGGPEGFFKGSDENRLVDTPVTTDLFDDSLHIRHEHF